MRMLVYAVLAVIVAGPAYAQEREQGWGLFFNRDTFEGTIFPIAMMAEDGDGFSKANLMVVCEKDGSLAPIFQPPMMFMDPGQYPIDFRADSKAEHFVFTVNEIPHLGGRLTIAPDDRTRFFDMFAPDVDYIAFRSKKGQGRFTTLAAAKVFEIVRESCPK